MTNSLVVHLLGPFFVLTALLPAQTTVFSTNFESGVPAQIASGTAAVTGVEGFVGLGPPQSQFGGSFLRSETGNVVELTVGNLPGHDLLHLDFLFAAIDSLDGAGTYPSGDYFRITVDGVTVFREAFANALLSQVQTYVPPAAVELARHQDLGFSTGFYHSNSAYHLGGDPFLASIPHSAASVRIRFWIEGPGIQSLTDESWAVDNLRVHVATAGQGSVSAFGISCGPILGAGGGVPGIGRPLDLVASPRPAGMLAVFDGIGLGNTTFGALVLPLPLDRFGAPGCWLLHDFAVVSGLPMSVAGPNASLSIGVPSDPGLVGLRLFHQTWGLAPGANSAGVVFSNGLTTVLGR